MFSVEIAVIIQISKALTELRIFKPNRNQANLFTFHVHTRYLSFLYSLHSFTEILELSINLSVPIARLNLNSVP